MKRQQIAGSLVIALCVAGSAWAHHTAAGIDQTKTVTVEGTIKQFKWANPHSWMEIEVPDGKGGLALWNAEMTSPSRPGARGLEEQHGQARGQGEGDASADGGRHARRTLRFHHAPDRTAAHSAGA